MSLVAVTLLLPREEADSFGDALLESGAVSVSAEDADEGTPDEKPIFGEPGADTGLWDHCRLSVLFPAHCEVGGIIREAAEAIAIALPDYTISPVDDVDWVLKNREQFQPISISERIWIVPTWHVAPHPDAINIVLDPGAAFGTGSHPTTRLCLQWLEHALQQPRTTNKPPKPLSALDYGCGSGILAIAALKLGAASAWGVDIDPQAVEAARFNATQNKVSLTLSTSDQPLDAVADITLANILANPLKVLAPLLAAHTVLGGRLVLAGILDHQAEDIIRIYHPWFALAVWRSAEGWSCIAGTRRNA